MNIDPGAPVVRARVHAFHVDSAMVDGVAQAVDDAMAGLTEHPDFRGLLFLEREGTRYEIVAITLWADGGLEKTEPEAERSRRQIARATDLGVSTKHYDVLRLLVPPLAVRPAEALRRAV
jgi:hypothetical protein